MIVSFERPGMWLLAQAATLQDTVYMKQVATERGWFETVTSFASVAMTIALLALAIGLIPAAWNFRKSYKKINELLDRVYSDVTPLVRHAHTTADNLDYITTALRTDLQQVSRTVNTANERLLVAVRRSESRLAEFSALLQVMQDEAEDVFVSTASTLRGVRTGAEAFGEVLEDDLASASRTMLGARLDERIARLEALAAEAAQDLGPTDEVEDGDDDDGNATADGHAALRPRIRPRYGRDEA